MVLSVKAGILLTALLTMSVCSASSCLTADSTLAMISVAGMLAGVTAKFSPFFNRDISASLRDLEDKLITQLLLSTYDVSIGDTAACFSRISFSNLGFFLVFGGVKDLLGVGLDLF